MSVWKERGVNDSVLGTARASFNRRTDLLLNSIVGDAFLLPNLHDLPHSFAVSSCALTFWICAECAFTVAVSAAICCADFFRDEAKRARLRRILLAADSSS
jgi:hypothetical protein